MAEWHIEQKTEVWYKTTVEADTFQEAIIKADEQGDWERGEDANWLNEYWGENIETEKQYTETNGVIQEEI